MPAKTAPAVTSDMKPVQEQLSCTFAERNSQQQYGELVSVDRFSFNQSFYTLCDAGLYETDRVAFKKTFLSQDEEDRLELVHTTGNGNCLMNAVARSINGSESAVEKMRGDLVPYLNSQYMIIMP